MSQFNIKTSSISMMDKKKNNEETVDLKTVNKRNGRLTKMLRSTAAASVLEFNQTLFLRVCLARLSGSEQLDS